MFSLKRALLVMPSDRERYAVLARIIARLNIVAAKHGVKLCDRHAGVDELKKLHRRLVLKLHSDKTGKATASPDWHEMQDAWDEWNDYCKKHAGSTAYIFANPLHGEPCECARSAGLRPESIRPSARLIQACGLDFIRFGLTSS